MGGHSDVFMGSAAVRDRGLAHRLVDGVHHMGWAVSGEDAKKRFPGFVAKKPYLRVTPQPKPPAAV